MSILVLTFATAQVAPTVLGWCLKQPIWFRISPVYGIFWDIAVKNKCFHIPVVQGFLKNDDFLENLAKDWDHSTNVSTNRCKYLFFTAFLKKHCLLGYSWSIHAALDINPGPVGAPTAWEKAKTWNKKPKRIKPSM